MSLRPAQALVAESSKFSLRTFFESKPTSSPLEATVDGLPSFNAPMAPVLPEPQPASPPSHPAFRPTTGSKEHKFTFNGLMPATTPIQMQHKLLFQHQQGSFQSTSASKPTLASHDGNEVLRLKAQVLALTERTNELSSNLASTSDSVVRGNKALMNERAQFHAKFSSVTKKLETTMAALNELESQPQEAVKNAKLLNAKILELQTENANLTQTGAQLETTLATKEQELSEVATLRAEAEVATGELVAVQARYDDLHGKYTTLSAQHSTVLERQERLAEELEEHRVLLEAASAEAATASERLESTKVEVATADQLVDELDAKLASARLEAAETPVAAAVCCPKTMRCQALECTASAARENMHGANEADCEGLAEEMRFAEAMAKRARWSLDNNTPERVMVAHVYTDAADGLDDAPCCLGANIRENRLAMGRPFDESFHLARVGASTAPAMSGRTNAFVQAVSADLKFHMDDSQALYKSSGTTGVALKI